MKKLLDNIIVLFVISIIALIIIPLSPVVLDMMLIFNMVLSLSILLITMYIKEALEFSVFPSILLIMTLFRVGLNVSSTRLILGHGGQAGQVIRTFGQFVIGGDPVVGFIIFIIIVIVQFVVITKGSERVAEVSARFTLDAMPGKQMAIDADLSAGLIDDESARQRRMKIQREADFYGAMDGASKFVKGDAIVSIIIVFINIIGGSIIGLTGSGGMDFKQVLSVYTVATVGDGLVSQIPALLVSTAMGMIVTRAASDNNLSSDLSRQLAGYPAVLMIAGGLLLVMCLIPGFPVWILLLLGGTLFVVGLKMESSRKAREKKEQEQALPPDKNEYFKNPENIYSMLGLEPVEMEFGYSLLPLVDESRGGGFVNRVVMLRKQFALEMGMVIPSVRIRDNAALSPGSYVIKLKGEQVAGGEVLVDHFLCIGTDGDEEEIEGIETTEPAFGLPAKWVGAAEREKAQIFGYTVIDPLSVIITHLSETMKKHAHELLGRREVSLLLDNLKKTNKTLVEESVPALVSIGDLQRLLSNLVMEQIPIRDLGTILETAANYAPTVKDPDLLTEYVRQALKRTITRKYADNGTMKVITVGTDLENLIINSVKRNENGSYVSMEPETMQKVLSVHMKETERIRELVKSPVVLTSPVVRLYYRKLIEQFVSETVVLSFNEIDAGVRVQSVGMIAI